MTRFSVIFDFNQLLFCYCYYCYCNLSFRRSRLNGPS